jgi:hypothetical protein
MLRPERDVRPRYPISCRSGVDQLSAFGSHEGSGRAERYSCGSVRHSWWLIKGHAAPTLLGFMNSGECPEYANTIEAVIAESDSPGVAAADDKLL